MKARLLAVEALFMVKWTPMFGPSFNLCTKLLTEAKSKFNELYQDYVCGRLLRVAREVQAHLPVSQTVVHALAEQLNPATGQIERHVILSAAMPRATLSKLNFTALDPSDSRRNFTHTMKFTKTGGFQAVDRVGLAAPLPVTRR